MARFCDVLSPMVYPSHFFGMDGYAKPGDAPEHFISESMQRFAEITAETKVVLRPWLQAFAWRTKTYSDAYIRTEVSAAKEQGGVGIPFLECTKRLFEAVSRHDRNARRAGPVLPGDEIRAAHRKSPPTPSPSAPAGAK